MVDDVENVSLVEIKEVEILGGALAEVGQAEDSLAGQGGEPSSDAQVFSSDPGIETAEGESAKQVAEENGTALGKGGGDDGRIVTAAGRERREEAKENKREEADRYREAESARRDAWLNKPDHDFGGIRMSGHDLDKLINFYSANPEILGRLQSRLSKNNDPEKVKKGVKEFEEALALEKKKSQGKQLTPEEQARYLEIQKSQEFKLVAQEAAIFAQSYGIKINAKMAEARAEIAAAVSDAEVNVMKVAEVTQKVLAEQSNAKKVETLKAEEDDGMVALGDVESVPVATIPAPASAAPRAPYVEASARDSFHSVPLVHKDFEASSGILWASSENKKFSSLGTHLQSGLENKNVEVDSTDMPVSVVTSQKMPLAMGSRA